MRKYLMEIYMTAGCAVWCLTIGLLLAFPGIRGFAVVLLFVSIAFILMAGRQKFINESSPKVSNTRPTDADEWERYE